MNEAVQALHIARMLSARVIQALSDIAINVAAITTNASNITALSSTVDTTVSNISALTTTTDTNTSDIATLASDVNDNAAAITVAQLRYEENRLAWGYDPTSTMPTIFSYATGTATIPSTAAPVDLGNEYVTGTYLSFDGTTAQLVGGPTQQFLFRMHLVARGVAIEGRVSLRVKVDTGSGYTQIGFAAGSLNYNDSITNYTTVVHTQLVTLHALDSLQVWLDSAPDGTSEIYGTSAETITWWSLSPMT
jgi:hypothetical protein